MSLHAASYSLDFALAYWSVALVLTYASVRVLLCVSKWLLQ